MSVTKTSEASRNGLKLVPPKELVNPALIEHARKRARSFSNRRPDHRIQRLDDLRRPARHLVRVLDRLGVESYPYGLLTMIVSLEAIFLSTFVMISQNRADEKREVIANQQWSTVQEEDVQNKELLDLSHQILELTKAVHQATGAQNPPR
jgi:hypothetical protein